MLFLREDLIRIVGSLLRGLRDPGERSTQDFRFGLAALAGSIPIGIVGLAFKDQIETTLRSLWFIGFALILFSAVMYWTDQNATQERSEKDITMRDTVLIGIAQCIALIPGISRSGATMSAGLLRGIDRVAVTRLSFFLSIPALAGAGLLESVTKASDISNGVGWGPTIVATIVAFIVGYASVAWLLRYVAHHNFAIFVGYRVVVGAVVLLLVASGAVGAT
jgi:undecaprenyl-diphosphatase